MEGEITVHIASFITSYGTTKDSTGAVPEFETCITRSSPVTPEYHCEPSELPPTTSEIPRAVQVVAAASYNWLG
jgi:hypothetical protein